MRGRAIAFALLGVLALIAAFVYTHRTDASGRLSTVPVGDFVVPPIVVDERGQRTFVASAGTRGNNDVTILDTKTGNIVGRAPMPSLPRAILLDTQRAHLFVAAGTNVRMLSARDWSVRRVIALPATVTGLAEDDRRGVVYAATIQPPQCSITACSGAVVVHMIDAQTGRRLRPSITFAGQGWADAGVAVSEPLRRLIVTGRYLNSSMVTIVSLDGRLLRRTNFGRGEMRRTRPLVDDALGRASIDLSMTGRTGGTSTSSTSKLYMFDLRTGALMRSVLLGNEAVDEALDTRAGYVVVATFGASRTVAVTHTTRHGAANTATSVTYVTHPVGAGDVRIIDARRGIVAATIPIGLATTGVAVDARRGYTYAINTGGADAQSGLPSDPAMLTILDLRQHTVLKRLEIGDDPLSLAIDDRSHRLVIAYGSSSRQQGPQDRWGWIRHWIPWLPLTEAPQQTGSSVSIFDTTHL